MASRSSSPCGSNDGSKPSTPTTPTTPRGRFASPVTSSPVFHDVFQPRPASYAQAVVNNVRSPILSPRLPSELVRTELLRADSFEGQPTQAIVSFASSLLDDLENRKGVELPQRITVLLKKAMQELERRIVSYSEHIRNLQLSLKSREEKYNSRVKVLERLALEPSEDPIRPLSPRDRGTSNSPRTRDEEVNRLMKEKEENIMTISKLKEHLDATKRSYEDKCHALELQQLEIARLNSEKQCANNMVSQLQKDLDDSRSFCVEKSKMLDCNMEGMLKLIKEKESEDGTIGKLKQELEEMKMGSDKRYLELEEKAKEYEKRYLESEERKRGCETRFMEIQETKTDYEKKYMEVQRELEQTKKDFGQRYMELETRSDEMKRGLENRLKEAEILLEESKRRSREMEALADSKLRISDHKEYVIQKSVASQVKSIQELRMSSFSLRQDVTDSEQKYSRQVNSLGQHLKVLVKAADKYHAVLAENRRLHNEVQELKGNIRVYCRIRPFLPGEDRKNTSIESVGDDGELIIANPTKPGKDGNKTFIFNRVFGPVTTQEQVFLDIQPLVRSVLDGFNVCIFAYGQTGSGKTYTMSGPNSPTEKDWGVNYRALNDLFNISRERKQVIDYEVGVQMIEIYNEQVRDLLSTDGVQKKLGIVNTSQPSGLAVPDATMQKVQSTSDVIDLMNLGFSNRAMSSTALNERSSRSHSILTVHVTGLDKKTKSTLRGSLHLVDLAGSERVDRSEVIGDRLKEAQHINKSLSALGDVIFALAQKNSHVPYRNSKLTQVLQTSLGGQAKTLMFVQVNPDASSYSETLSTLKFAERVSSVELGAAKNNKEGKEVQDLMELVADLKDTIAKKDNEIERLQHYKTSTPRATKSSTLLKHSSSSPGISSLGRAARSLVADSDGTDTSEAGSQKSSRLSGNRSPSMDMDNLVGFDEDSEDRLSDNSDIGNETDGSSSLAESALLPEQDKTAAPQAAQDKVPASAQPVKEKLQKATTATTRMPKSSPLKLAPSSPKSGQPSPAPPPLRVKPRETTTSKTLLTSVRKTASTQGIASSPKTGKWK
ncbi:P-loop containing nucleoside triphosphate hydrolases superfamily protein [Rhynchospora pubera]|uniref:P-loop containing nucleoside triphosphate hydrolases superfamily protein n=1 Tax=Rhynchospora pubera TaxID=906938 RepID=A0AAV8H1E8_9POAL|nr:P-loop containing nucleoside triphosphate hydrolases superfamily protein [Rhynchospora pubera]